MRIFPVLLFTACVWTSSGFASSHCQFKHARVESAPSLTPAEIWHASQAEVAESGVVIVQFSTLDIELQLTADGSYQCGFGMVGTSDLGIQPVAFRVWAHNPCHVFIKVIDSSEAGEYFAIVSNNVVIATVGVEENLSVSINGKKVGKIIGD